MEISGRLFINCIDDGSTLSAVIRSDKTLTQMYSAESGACSPDWTVAANQPTAYVVTRMGGTVKLALQTVTWQYNGTTITFDENGYSTNFTWVDGNGDSHPTFQKGFSDVASLGLSTPWLKVLGNLATVGNTDQDVLTCMGSVEISGAPLNWDVSTPIRISTLAGSGYYGWIEGDAMVTSGTVGDSGYTATMEAHLTNGTNPVSGFQTEWFREGIDAQATPFKAKSASSTCSINASQIEGHVVMRCDIYDSTGNSLLYSAFWEVEDMLDKTILYIRHGANNQNAASLHTGQSVDFMIYAGMRADETKVDSRFNQFRIKLRCPNGTITDTTSADSPILGKTLDTEGFADITVNDLTVPVAGTTGGRLSCSHAFGSRNGGAIEGFINARSVS